MIWRFIHLRWIWNAGWCVVKLWKRRWYLLSHVNFCCVSSEFWIMLQFWEWVCKSSVLSISISLAEGSCTGTRGLYFTNAVTEEGAEHSLESKSQRHADASRRELLVAQVVMQCVTKKKTNQEHLKTDFWNFSEGGGNVRFMQLESKVQKLWKLVGFWFLFSISLYFIPVI